MLPVTIIASLIAALVIVGLAFFGTRPLAASTAGRVALLVGLGALPLLVSVGGLAQGVAESSRTRFCLSCHEMQNHGKSMFVDSRHALAAVHYQNRLIDRDTICFSCHTDYGLFGDAHAKLNGLRHVLAHYVTGVPEKLALYKPYANANCLHCHDDARRFQEAPPHKPIVDALYAGRTSCLDCHRIVHDLDAVRANNFWQAQ
jgi:cytochrome c-type protein NapC